MNILSTTFALLSGSLITLILDGFLSRRRRRFRAALPPSPKSLPLFGSFFSIPTKQPWKTYTTWARELNSELISVWAFGHLTIIISSAKAARELLSYRAANYGDRPRMPVLDLSTMSDVLAALMPYGERWRTHRRFLHRNFNLTTVSEYQPMQAAQIMHLLQDIYREPNSVRSHIQRFTASLSFRVAYGLHMSDGQEQIAAEVVEANESVLDCTLPGASTVNIFPVLRYIPKWLFGASFHTIVHQCREVFAQVREESYTRAKASLVIEESTPSFMRSVLEDTASPTPSEERDVKDVAFQIFVGSAETTLPAICAVILALALYPDVQSRAQAELDMVTGRARLPTYDDKDALPYIEAIVRETLRWCPVTPVGVPRSTINDDVYEGMFIPAGTTVIWNSWAITHDPEVYPEPDAFYPDRYIDADGRVALDEDISIFGFGRRECPGMHFARNTLFLVTASILSLFDLSKIKDKDGNSVEIDADFTDGVVSHVKDFGCSIRPRDEQAVNLLNMIK